MSLCSWNDSHGTTCKWPGPFSSDTHGGGRYYCIWHWRAFGLDKIDMKAEGDRAVRESLEWDGSPESYLALRAEASKKAQVRKAQAEVCEPVRSEPIQPIHAFVSGVVPNLQPEYAGDF